MAAPRSTIAASTTSSPTAPSPTVPRPTLWREPDLAVAHLDRHGLERTPQAGTVHAHAVGDAEQRAMHAAQNVAPLEIEEIVGLPIEIEPEMRADIDVGPDDAAQPHDHDVGLDAVACHRVAPTAAVGDVVDPADRAHPSPPPSLTIRAQALASIGITDRR